MFATDNPMTISQQDGVSVVEFTANKILDEVNIRQIGDQIGDLVDASETPRLVMDFSRVDHLSSAALGMLIRINNKVRSKNGFLRLTGIKPQILEVFRMTKLDMLFKITPTRELAIESIVGSR